MVSSASTTGGSQLPEDVVYNIASFVADLGDLCSSALVSRSWRAAASPHFKRLYLATKRDPREAWNDLENASRVLGSELAAWRAMAARELRLVKAWNDGNTYIRWVPHVFDKEHAEICAVLPDTGEVFCSVEDVADGEVRFNSFIFDKRLQPLPRTKSGGYTHSKFPRADLSFASVDGLEPVLLASAGLRCDGEASTVEIWLTPTDHARFTALESASKSELGDASEMDGFLFLASFKAVLEYFEENVPAMEYLVALHVDYDANGPTALVAATTYEGVAALHTIAKTSRLLDAETDNGDPGATTFDHDLRLDGWGQLWELAHMRLDNDYLVVIDQVELRVWSRRTGEHVMTLERGFPEGGPLVNICHSALGKLDAGSDYVREREREFVPGNSTRTLHVRVPAVVASSPGYRAEAEILDTNTGFSPESLILTQGNLIFSDALNIYVLKDYAAVCEEAAKVPDGVDSTPTVIAPRLVTILTRNPNLIEEYVSALSPEGYDFVIRARGNHLFYLSHDVTYLLDLSRVPTLPTDTAFGIDLHMFWGPTRDLAYMVSGFDTERALNRRRYFMSRSGLYEVVPLTPDQGQDEHGAGYHQATRGFPKAICWQKEWDGRQNVGSAIRVFSFEDHDKFKGEPPASILVGEATSTE
ncbi:uncharacterized protein LOC62_07G008838 [Vanrija pseudolonga]|uniref:F-box domain-containing protein n=1 Tax=Vanrija pseudolonga TaxID=143232 RepID=A0AAF0YEP5_9TREE|nr:hypothetical protein LOC62_07G008838 [Vanrija pseudolonga]